MKKNNPNKIFNKDNTQRNFKQAPYRAVIGKGLNNSAAIVVDKDESLDWQDDKFLYTGKNARISLLVGTNGSEWAEQNEIGRIDYGSTPAGVVISERTTPGLIFYRDAEGKKQPARVLGVAAPMDNLTKTQIVQSRPQLIQEINKAEPSVTLFGGTVQLVSFQGGVNIYTNPWKAVAKSGQPTTKTMGNMGVKLIHGNKSNKLEPMVLGNKLNKDLDEMHDLIRDLRSRVFNLGTQVMKISGMLGVHTHVSAVGPVSPSPSLAANAMMSVPGQIKEVFEDVAHAINSITSKLNRTDAFKSSFKSDYHKLN